MKRSYIIAGAILLTIILVGPFLFKFLLGTAINYFIVQGGSAGPGVLSPVVMTDTVCFGSTVSKLSAVDTKTRKLKWETATDGWTGYTLVGHTIYLMNGDGTLAELDVDTGKTVKRIRTETRAGGAPVIVDDKAILSDYSGHIFAIDLNTGKRLWKYQVNGNLESVPVADSGVVCFGTLEGDVYALDIDNGKLKWKFKVGHIPPETPPLAAGGVAYIGSLSGGIGENGALIALDIRTGKRKWRFEPIGGISSSPTLVDGIVYAGSGDQNLYAVDMKIGRQKWEFLTGGMIFKAPVIAGDTAYLASGDGYLYAVDLKTAKQSWKAKAGAEGNSQPAVKDGIVYIGDRGKLLALDSRSGKMVWEYKLQK